MKTAEAKTATKAPPTKTGRPFFSRKGGGRFLGKPEPEKPFFDPSAAYSMNGNDILQTKLTIGQPNDKYEKEADAMADKVVQRLAEPQIQRKCTECEKKDERLQMKSDVSGLPAASQHIESGLNSSKSRGNPLPQNTRTQMESSFGTDFSGVRLHTDNGAVQMNKDLHAQAFTHGSDIYFNAGKYSPESSAGKHLLAHELTHVVQQGNNGLELNWVNPIIQLQPNNCTNNIANVPQNRDPNQEVQNAHNTAVGWVRLARIVVQDAIVGASLSRHEQRLLNRHFGNLSPVQLRVIRNRFNLIAARLQRGDRIYFCNTAGSIDCRVAGTQAATFCPSASEFTRLCPQFFVASLTDRPLILIHEAAHAANACGHIYIGQNYPGPNPPNNAEAYAQFAHDLGFLSGSIPLPPRQTVLPPLIRTQ